MPYVQSEYREKLDPLIAPLQQELMHTDAGVRAGCVNYVITKLLQAIAGPFNLNKGENPVWGYRTLNEAVGVLECVKLELNRRVIGEYEDKKISENGDVLEYLLWKNKV